MTSQFNEGIAVSVEQDKPPAPPIATRSASFLVVPLVGVTSFAIFGQFATIYAFLNPAALVGLDDLNSWGWLRLVLAVGAAAVFESMALFVQYQAHTMLLLQATSTAAKHRRISYGFAAGAALIQYWHFSDEWAPTPLAIMFAAFSAAGPWLWGLHTRHVKRLHLLREGQVDSIGATFSSERWRAFPWRTWQARRWSIDRGVDDPREAWAGFKTDRATRKGQPTPARRVALLLAVTQLVARMPHPTPKARRGTTPVVERPAPDPKLVDDRGLSHRWETAPLAVAPDPALAPARARVVAQLDEQGRPDYLDKSLPLERRVDLAVAAEFAAGAKTPPGQRRIAGLLGESRAKVRTVFDKRAAASRNGHLVETS